MSLTASAEGARAVRINIQRRVRRVIDVSIDRKSSGVNLIIVQASADEDPSSSTKTSDQMLFTPVNAGNAESCQADNVSPTQARLTECAAAMGISSLRFARVPAGYYDQSLEWRRNVLGALNTSQVPVLRVPPHTLARLGIAR